MTFVKTASGPAYISPVLSRDKALLGYRVLDDRQRRVVYHWWLRDHKDALRRVEIFCDQYNQLRATSLLDAGGRARSPTASPTSPH
jgi:hypothetical protein